MANGRGNLPIEYPTVYCHSCGKEIMRKKNGENIPCKCHDEGIAQYYEGKRSGDYTGD